MNKPNIKQILTERASIFTRIRQFFENLNVMEVDTRLLDQFSVTDPYMSVFKVSNSKGVHGGFLQTSPEYSMKRLLSMGSGDIYQLGKVFRADEQGRHHDCEFTLLEWYRLGFGIEVLMGEVYSLVSHIVGKLDTQHYSYREAFIKFVDLDPFCITDQELELVAREKLGLIPADMLRDNYLTLLFCEIIEPALDSEKVTFISHYPASQASLAQIVDSEGVKVAERFEVYCGGLELANGFNELTDPKEQKARFEQDNLIRRQLNLMEVDIDTRLIQALERGLPECSGVALGVDRLLMIKLRQNNIANILPLD